jgi:hypothetical protein
LPWLCVRHFHRRGIGDMRCRLPPQPHGTPPGSSILEPEVPAGGDELPWMAPWVSDEASNLARAGLPGGGSPPRATCPAARGTQRCPGALAGRDDRGGGRANWHDGVADDPGRRDRPLSRARAYPVAVLPSVPGRGRAPEACANFRTAPPGTCPRQTLTLACLPGQPPVKPQQHRPDHRAVVPSPVHDLATD